MEEKECNNSLALCEIDYSRNSGNTGNKSKEVLQLNNIKAIKVI